MYFKDCEISQKPGVQLPGGRRGAVFLHCCQSALPMEQSHFYHLLGVGRESLAPAQPTQTLGFLLPPRRTLNRTHQLGPTLPV